MIRLMVRISCLIAFLMIASLALAQTEFSADIVDNQRGDKGLSKVYFGKDKMRFDSKDDSDVRGGGAVIFDFSNESWVLLMAKQHIYMEMPTKMMESRGMFSFFKSGDVDNACSDWLKLANHKGGTCHKVGREAVNGRDTVKYEGANAEGESSTVWLDSKLRFPVKWEDKKGGGEMRNIQEGAQPASLFEIPAGFTKMDMGGMMKHPQ